MSNKVQARQKARESAQRDHMEVGPSAVHSGWGFLILCAALSTPVFMMSWEMRQPPSKLEAALADAPFVLNNLQLYCNAPGVLERKCHVRLQGQVLAEELSMPVTADSFPADYSVYLTETETVRVKTRFTGEELDLATAKSRLLWEANATAAEFIKRRKESEQQSHVQALSTEAKARNLATYP